MFKNSFVFSIFLHLLLVILLVSVGFFSTTKTIKLNTYNIQIVTKVSKSKDTEEKIANKIQEDKVKTEAVKSEKKEIIKNASVIKKIEPIAPITKNQPSKEIKNIKPTAAVKEIVNSKALVDKK